ncbi:MAG: hypothetical protein U9R23_08060 [Candidatus Cloacimonadota bacterium]|nr:hypothetical protein [Candidatus Cloacimonadota bacterium]
MKNALKTIKNPSEIEKLLIEKLQEYQIFTLDFQKKLKYNGDLKATEFFIELSKRAKVIQQYLLENLDDENEERNSTIT